MWHGFWRVWAAKRCYCHFRFALCIRRHFRCWSSTHAISTEVTWSRARNHAKSVQHVYCKETNTKHFQETNIAENRKDLARWQHISLYDKYSILAVTWQRWAFHVLCWPRYPFTTETHDAKNLEPFIRALRAQQNQARERFARLLWHWGFVTRRNTLNTQLRNVWKYRNILYYMKL